MVHNLPLPYPTSDNLPPPTAERQSGNEPHGLYLTINKAQKSLQPMHIEKRLIKDSHAHIAAEYAQYQTFAKIDLLEPLYIRIGRFNPTWFLGRGDLAARIVKGFRYGNDPTGFVNRAGGMYENLNLLAEVVPLEPRENVDGMTVDEAREYVMEMVDLAWRVNVEMKAAEMAVLPLPMNQREADAAAAKGEEERKLAQRCHVKKHGCLLEEVDGQSGESEDEQIGEQTTSQDVESDEESLFEDMAEAEDDEEDDPSYQQPEMRCLFSRIGQYRGKQRKGYMSGIRSRRW